MTSLFPPWSITPPALLLLSTFVWLALAAGSFTALIHFFQHASTRLIARNKNHWGPVKPKSPSLGCLFLRFTFDDARRAPKKKSWGRSLINVGVESTPNRKIRVSNHQWRFRFGIPFDSWFKKGYSGRSNLQFVLIEWMGSGMIFSAGARPLSPSRSTASTGQPHPLRELVADFGNLLEAYDALWRKGPLLVVKVPVSSPLWQLYWFGWGFKPI